MVRTQHRLAVGLLLAAALTACSSAPAPAVLGLATPSSKGGPSTGPDGGPAVGSTAPGGVPGGTSAAPGGSRSRTGTAGATLSGPVGPRATSPAGTGSASGGSTLFTPAEDRIGITPTQLRLCVHAALTYGAAFNTSKTDFNVFWDALNAEKGGIFGRKVVVDYQNDNYDPATAVTAAKTCVAEKIFLLLGGIGFDQIPSVRNYVEQVHQLYLYHSATVNGSRGLRYSFTELPTVERVGEGFAQLALAKFAGKRIGILERDSANWAPGVTAFKAMASRYGLKIVGEEKAGANAGNYTSQINNLKNVDHADVVWIWLNALETTEVVKQIKAQLWSPNLLVFPFNLTSQTLGSDAMNPPMDGVAMYPAYSAGDYSGTFAPYADDIKEFEAQYAKYDRGAQLNGVGGDLLFLNWVGQKALYRQLLLCGRDCTRNKFVDVLQHYDATPVSSGCPIDFRDGDHHHGAQDVTYMTTYNSPSGKVNWRITKQCVTP